MQAKCRLFHSKILRIEMLLSDCALPCLYVCSECVKSKRCLFGTGKKVDPNQLCGFCFVFNIDKAWLVN